MSAEGRYQAEVDRLRRQDEEYQRIELALVIGNEIRLLMEDQGVSKAELARRLGVSPQYVSRLLRDEGHNMTLGTLAKVASALGICLTWRFGASTESGSSPTTFGRPRRRWVGPSPPETKKSEEPPDAFRLAA